MLELWHSINGLFNPFDGITYATMAIIVVGAAFMMPNLTSIITATFAALVIFALAVFSRTALAAKDAETLARSDWNDLLALPLHTLFLYASLFAVAITVVHSLRALAQR